MKTVVEEEILKLPTPPSKSGGRKRKRVKVGGRLLTHDVLQEAEIAKASPGASTPKTSKQAVPCMPVVADIVESALV